MRKVAARADASFRTTLGRLASLPAVYLLGGRPGAQEGGDFAMSEGIKTFIYAYISPDRATLLGQSNKTNVATNIIKHFREITALLPDPLGERSVREIS